MAACSPTPFNPNPLMQSDVASRAVGAFLAKKCYFIFRLFRRVVHLFGAIELVDKAERASKVALTRVQGLGFVPFSSKCWSRQPWSPYVQHRYDTKNPKARSFCSLIGRGGASGWFAYPC